MRFITPYKIKTIPTKTNTEFEKRNINPATIKEVQELAIAKEMELSSIAIPGMGTGVGGVAHRKAAETIVKMAKEFEDSFETIFLVDRDKEMIDSFNGSL